MTYDRIAHAPPSAFDFVLPGVHLKCKTKKNKKKKKNGRAKGCLVEINTCINEFLSPEIYPAALFHQK